MSNVFLKLVRYRFKCIIYSDTSYNKKTTKTLFLEPNKNNKTKIKKKLKHLMYTASQSVNKHHLFLKPHIENKNKTNAICGAFEYNKDDIYLIIKFFILFLWIKWQSVNILCYSTQALYICIYIVSHTQTKHMVFR